MVLSLCLGFLLGTALYLINTILYEKMLVRKADAPKYGQSNIIFLLGKPYVILHEKDYIKNCKIWYSK